MIDPDDCDADRMSSATFESRDLVPKIVNHAVDLFDHGLRQDLDLNADFNRRDRTASDRISRIENCRLTGNNLAERPVASPGLNTASPVLDVQNTILASHSFQQLGRTFDCDQIFKQ